MALEEADKILLLTLSEIGLDADGISSLGELQSDQVVEAVALCLSQIDPEMSGIPRKAPTSLAAKLSLCTALAKNCQDLGYKGDLGYQTFLYGSSKEIRNILSFLVDKLPRVEPNLADTSVDSRTALLQSTGAVLKQALQRCWTPHYCRPTTDFSRPFQPEPVSLQTGTYLNLQPTVVGRVMPSVLDWAARLGAGPGPSILSLNRPGQAPQGGSSPAVELTLRSAHIPPTKNRQPVEDGESGDPSVPADPVVSQTPPVSSPEDSRPHIDQQEDSRPHVDQQEDSRPHVDQQRESELTEINQRLDRSLRKLERGAERYRKLEAACAQLRSTCAALTAALAQRRAALALRQRARQAVDAGADTEAGAGAVGRAQQRAARRQREWTQRRAELELRLAELRQTALRSPRQELRGRRQELAAELQEKERALVTLRQRASSSGKHIKRSAYTKRIMEIVGSVRKQRQAIVATIEETKELRKNINTTTAKIARTFEAAEEMIFRDAVGSEWSRACYKGVVSLHEACSELIALVEQTGAVIRQTRRLQETIDMERSQHVEESLRQVTADLERVKLDNQLLLAKHTDLT